MTPDELDELLGAYALDAVSDLERTEIDAYLTVSPRARDEVAQHREVAALLAAGGSPAPAHLWDAIAASLEEAPPSARRVLAPIVSIDRRRRDRRRAGLEIAVAAVAASIIAVLAVRVVDQRRQLHEQNGASALIVAMNRAMTDPDAKRTVLTVGTAHAPVAVEGTVGYLEAKQLPALPQDRTYQLWGRIDGRMISLGVLGRQPTEVAFAVAPSVDLLAISDEAASGVAQPTGEVVAQGALA
jgi:anti-sigma-K factor RskA